MIDVPDFAPELSAFEPLHGKSPISVLDAHPDGRHVALQTPPIEYVERAAVWDVETRALVWAPDSVSALAWFPGGDEIAAVAELFTPAPEKRGIFVAPLQSESAWTFEQRVWPAADVVDACAIRSVTGWFDGVIVSPLRDVALVRWTDQTETGLIAVGLDGELEQRDAAWETRETNWLKGPAFSPDGSLVAVFLNPPGASNWWGGEEDEDPSPGGEFAIATLVVLDVDDELAEVHREPIAVEVRAGWLPDAGSPYGRGLVRPPRFDDAGVVVDDPLTGRRSIRVR